MNITVAVDCMGGDHGPHVTVPAAVEYLHRNTGSDIILVGLPDVIEAELRAARSAPGPRLRIHAASEVVSMDESPALALRGKKNSSMRVAINLVKSGEAQACVSAGNTGALIATSRFVLKTLPGIDRPALAVVLPTIKGHTYVLDLGANVDCKPKHLLQFAVDQRYDDYTSVDHAVWRFIMRQNMFFLKEYAHKVYFQGLLSTGISFDRIPRIQEMNDILAKIGWGAVAVDGLHRALRGGLRGCNVRG